MKGLKEKIRVLLNDCLIRQGVSQKREWMMSTIAMLDIESKFRKLKRKSTKFISDNIIDRLPKVNGRAN
jgi:hypothetical protein